VLLRMRILELEQEQREEGAGFAYGSVLNFGDVDRIRS
jgi:hypothetical protein